MKRMLALLTLGLLLSGCAAHPLSDDEVRAEIAHGNAVIVVGYDMPAGPAVGFWGMDIRRIDPATGKPETPAREGNSANSAALLDYASAPYSTERRYGAYVVRPGEYAVTSIGPREGPGGPVYVPNFGGTGGGGAGAGAGLIGLAVLATIAAAGYAAQAAEDEHFGDPGRPPLMFLYENQLVDDTPRFTVRPGEAVYLGDILYGVKQYTIETTEVPRGPNAADEPKTSRRVVGSPFIEYLVDEAGARAKLAAMGLSNVPERTVTLAPLTHGPVYVSPRMTRERLEWRSSDPIAGEKIVMARPELPRPLPSSGSAAALSATRRPNAQTPLPAAPTRVTPAQMTPTQATPRSAPAASLDELQERFLSGKISKDEYERARAKLSSGS